MSGRERHVHEPATGSRLAVIEPIDPAHAHAHADIWLSDVTVGYGDRPALEGINLAIEPGSLLAVVGPNADSLDVLEANYNGTAADPVTPWVLALM